MTSDNPDLSAFPDEDFRFSLGIREGDAAEFFGPSAAREGLLAMPPALAPGGSHAVCGSGGELGADAEREVELLAGGWGCAPSHSVGDELGRLE